MVNLGKYSMPGSYGNVLGPKKTGSEARCFWLRSAVTICLMSHACAKGIGETDEPRQKTDLLSIEAWLFS